MPRPKPEYRTETITISAEAAAEVRAEAGRRKVPAHVVAHEWIMQAIHSNMIGKRKE